MKSKSFFFGLGVLSIVALALMGAVTYPPSSGSSSTVITNVTIITNVDNIITTNLTVYQTFSVSGKATLQQVIITNGIGFITNRWNGPSNSLPMHLQRQRYVTYTPIAITGYTSLSNNMVESPLLSIHNAATTNILATVWGITSTGFTNQYTVSNESVGKFWFEYDPSGPETNLVYRQVK